MAVVANPYDSRLTLTFYTGDDTEGNPLESTKSFARVKHTATDQDVYDVAQALASLQTFVLVSVERADRAALVEV